MFAIERIPEFHRLQRARTIHNEAGIVLEYAFPFVIIAPDKDPCRQIAVPFWQVSTPA